MGSHEDRVDFEAAVVQFVADATAGVPHDSCARRLPASLWTELCAGHFHVGRWDLRPGCIELVGEPEGASQSVTLFVERRDARRPSFVAAEHVQMGYRRIESDEVSVATAEHIREALAGLAERDEALLRILGAGRAESAERPHSVFFYAQDLLDCPRLLREVIYRNHLGGRTADVSAESVAGRPILLEIDLGVRCAQACVFCPAPLMSAPFEAVAATRAMIAALVDQLLPELAKRHPKVIVCLQGGDALRHPEIVAFLQMLMGQPCEVTILSPGTRLADPAFVRQVKESGALSRVSTTVFAADAGLHDAIAGRRGAFEALVQGLENLAQAGISYSLNTVVLRSNLPHLPALLGFAQARRSPLCINMLKADSEEHERLLPPLLPALDDVRETLQANAQPLLAHGHRIRDLPICATPKPLRGILTATPYGAGRSALASPRECARCAVRDSCCGVSRIYVDTFGERGLQAL